MQIGTLYQRLRERQIATRIVSIVLVVLVFGLGYATGNGKIKLVRPTDYTDVTGLPSQLDYDSVNQLYNVLKANYNGTLSQDQVLDGIKHGTAEATNDPYTQYFTPKEAKAFNGELQGVSLTGIGAQLDEDSDGNVVVIAPINGSPAEAAGLKAKDIITSINGESTVGMGVDKAVTKIRGKKGTTVTLGIQRDGQALTLTITRDVITVPTATSKILDNNIGYLQVSQFSDGTYGLVQKAVADFKAQGVKRVILDLRDNPGGEVTSAQRIASLWLNANDLVMQEKRGTKVVDSYRATGQNSLQGMPTVVLVNNGSASASEITALALRDNKAATILGQKSYGKGVVQSVIPFEDGSELKVTIAKWYSPSGTSINKKGITPDKVVAQSDADTTAGVDTQLEAAKAILITK